MEGPVWRFLRLARRGPSTSGTKDSERWITFVTSNGSYFTALFVPGPTTQSILYSSGTLGWQPIISTEYETFCAIELSSTYPTEEPNSPATPNPKQPPTTSTPMRPLTTPRLDLTEMPTQDENLFLNYAWTLALEQNPRIILKAKHLNTKLQAYYLGAPKSMVFPQSANTAVLPNFPPNLQIVNFKPSRANLKFIYNHLVRANNAKPSPWCPSPDGIWFLLARRLTDATYSQLIERILRN